MRHSAAFVLLAVSVHVASALAFDGDDYNYCRAGFPDAAAYSPVADATLVSLQLVTRHGDRAPNSALPHENVDWVCSPDEARTQAADESFWTIKRTLIPDDHPFRSTSWGGDCEPGQLTYLGAKMTRELGAVLRSIYIDRLGCMPSTLEDSRDIAVRSTAVWRTQQSASNLLGGLYPRESRGAKASSIAVNNYPDALETMTGNSVLCARLAALFAAQAASKEYQDMMEAHKGLLAELARITGTANNSAWAGSFDHFADQFHTRTCHGLPLPCAADNSTDCVTRDMAERTIAMRDWEYLYDNYLFRRVDTARAGVGSFLGEIVRNMRRAAAGGPDHVRLRMYSGHDGTIAALLGALNQGGWRHPPYAANLIFEVWRKHAGAVRSGNVGGGIRGGAESGHVVRVMYNGRWLTPFGSRDGVSGAALDEFVRDSMEVVPDDYRAECMHTDI
eukprot:Opistho-2@74723